MGTGQSRQEVDRDYHAFFELLGHFVTRYQSVEDHLANVFSAALGDHADWSKAIFETARGIDPKLKLIDAGLIGADESHRETWKALRKLVQDAHETRGSLAHCTPVSAGSVVIFIDSDQPGHSENWMEARKQTKRGEQTWKVEDLRVELNRVSKLFSALIALVTSLVVRHRASICLLHSRN